MCARTHTRACATTLIIYAQANVTFKWGMCALLFSVTECAQSPSASLFLVSERTQAPSALLFLVYECAQAPSALLLLVYECAQAPSALLLLVYERAQAPSVNAGSALTWPHIHWYLI